MPLQNGVDCISQAKSVRISSVTLIFSFVTPLKESNILLMKIRVVQTHLCRIIKDPMRV